MFEGIRARVEAIAGFSDQNARHMAVATLTAQLTLILLPTYGVFAWFVARPPLEVYLLLGFDMLAALVALFLVRRELGYAGAHLMIICVWATFVALTLLLGLHTPNWAMLHGALVLTGLLLSARATLVATAGSILVVLASAALHRHGYYGPTAPLFPDFVAPIMQLAATGSFIAALMFSFTSVVRRLASQQDELAQSEAQLRRAEKMDAFGQLAGGVAHDFNNILTGMLGHIDMLRMHAETGEVGDEFHSDLDEMERSAERAAEITRQLLTFSRKEGPEHAVANVARVLEEADPMLRSLTRENVELRVISELAVRVKLSKTSVEQILMNLVINANDAMPRGGALAITTSEVEVASHREVSTGLLASGKYLRLTISDSGEGISKDLRERVFEPFFTTKAVGRGTGLGLSTVLGIVQRAGGQLDIESRAGRGTTFSVFLPISDEDTPDQNVGRTIPPPNVETGTVLVCEDDAMILRVMTQALVGAGYDVVACPHPEEALSRGLQLGDDLVLLVSDVIMPGMNGRELAEKLAEARGEFPVLFVSGYTAGLLSDLGIDAADQRLLRKPFTPHDLVKRVRETLAAKG